MAAPTITLLKATPNRLVYSVVADNTGTAGLLSSAVLLADAAQGPLKTALRASYASQAAMRLVIGGGHASSEFNVRAGLAIVSADVDVDAVTPARPEVNITISAATVEGYLILEWKHTGSVQ